MKEKRSSWKSKIIPAFLWIVLLVISLFVIEILVRPLVVSPPNTTNQPFTSLDWAGYAVSSDLSNPQSVVTGINASWIVPTVSVSPTDQFSAMWIGIGGEVDETLIQTGVEQDSTSGFPQYSAWYELLPSDSVEIPSINVHPGDEISASIALVDSNADQWLIEIHDYTQNQTFSQIFYYPSLRLSAEWIIERPTVNNSIAQLADFGVATFANATATVGDHTGSINDFPFSQILMINRQNNQLVGVSSLTSDGTSFTLTYL